MEPENKETQDMGRGEGIESQGAPEPQAPQGGGGSHKKSKTPMVITIIIILLLIAGGAVYYYAPETFSFGNGEGDTATEVNGDAVAMVNGTALTQSMLDRQVTQLQQQLAAQGQQNVPEAQVREQALNQLISQELLVQAARDEGVSVADEQVEQQYQSSTAQFESEEQLNAQLSQLGYTPESFRENIRRQLLIQQYVNPQVNQSEFTITDEEIQAAYDEASAGQQGLPALSEIRDQIESQLQQQRLNEFVDSLVQQLREAGDVQILNQEEGGENESQEG